MENDIPSASRRPSAFFIMVVSFILGSFSGAVVGVLFALSLNEQQFPWRLPSAATDGAPLRLVSAEDAQVIAAAKQVSPAVVSIVVTREVAQYDNRTGPLSPFEEFFGFEAPPPPERLPGKQQVGGGTGFIVSADGLIVTNRHVVADEKAEYDVVLSDGQTLSAKVLARDAVLDLAFLKIESGDRLPTAAFGDSDRLQIGETVIAIGNALSEYRNTVTKGVISGINRRVVAGDGGGNAEVIEEALQTDAAINPGNSGGPLINLRGEVVGVNTAVNRAGQSIGFAIPINAAGPIIESVKTSGKIVRPWLGVRYVLLTKSMAEENGLKVESGALVSRGGNSREPAVVPGSPADRAGIKENDVLLQVDGVDVGSDHPLSSLIGRKRPGDLVTVKLLRDGAERTVTATLGELPSEFK